MALAKLHHCVALSGLLAIGSFNVTAAPISGGQAQLSLNPQAWQNLGITLDNVMTSPESLTLSVSALMQQPAAETFDSQSASPYTFDLLMGESPYLDTQRRLAPLTSFTVTGQDAQSIESTARGELSLAGVTRWVIAPVFGGGNLIFGDLTLRFNTDGQRWEISNNIDFPGVIYSLGTPQISVTDTQIVIAGDLIGDTFLDSMVVGSAGQDLGDLHVTMTRANDGTIRAADALFTYHLPLWASVGLTDLDNVIGAEGVSYFVGPVEGDDLLDVATAADFDASAAHHSPMLAPATTYQQASRLAPTTYFDADISSESAFTAESRGHMSLIGAVRLSSALGNILLGDFTLEYLPNDAQWQVVNNISFSSTAFTVENAQVTINNDETFDVTGNLVGSTQLGSLIPGAEGTVLGDIHFTTGTFSAPAPAPTPDPTPTPIASTGGSSGGLLWLFPLGLIAMFKRRKLL